MYDNEEIIRALNTMLPPIEKSTRKDEADYYGASRLIENALHLPFKPKCFSGWKHGWLFNDLTYEEQIIGAKKEYSQYLVAKKEHQSFLHSKGIKAYAVGMPFVYVDKVDTMKVKRYANSLLVMPPHSLPYTTHSWDEANYAKQISELKKDFELIVVCLHHSCVQKRLWIDVFTQYGIPWIIGADSKDKNALIRMRRLFLSFEYMTTNTIGSHVVYAAYCKCKVSIYGVYQEYTEEDYKNDKVYQKKPFLLTHNLKGQSEKSVRVHYPFLFTDPKNAQIQKSWADSALGEENIRSFEELSRLLQWTWRRQMQYILVEFPIKVWKKLCRMVCHTDKQVSNKR